MKSLLARRIENLLKKNGIECGDLKIMAVSSSKRRCGKAVLFAFEDGKSEPSFVVKAALDGKNGAGRMEEERERYLSSIKGNPFLSERLKMLFDIGRPDPFIVEPFVRGVRMPEKDEQESALRRALDWLVEMQKAGRPTHASHGYPPLATNSGLKPLATNTTVWNREKLIADIRERFDFIRKFAGRMTSVDRFVENYLSSIEDMEDFMVEPVVCHGDFGLANIFFDQDSIHVVDWEFMRPADWPFIDLWHLIAFVNWGSRSPEKELVRAVVEGRGRPRFMKDILKLYAP
ncbi:MAG: phosphotransferase, partial [Deltaproteobacteria bacterium]|nr:phosphotransferase [Deltaproteobacteria bacterium]